jgi:hypothetical protein
MNAGDFALFVFVSIRVHGRTVAGLSFGTLWNFFDNVGFEHPAVVWRSCGTPTLLLV